MKAKAGALLLAALLVTASITAARSLGTANLMAHVIASGGQEASSTTYTMVSSVGQPAVGLAGGATITLCGGYWCGNGIPPVKTYLPLALRN